MTRFCEIVARSEPRAEALGQLRRCLKLLAGHAPAQHRCAHIREARLPLRMNADVIAQHLVGNQFFHARIELVAHAPIQLVEKTLRRSSLRA